MFSSLFKKKAGKKTQILRKALLIGCNYPGSASELNGCINDVNAMKKYLLTHAGFQDTDITVLTDHLSATPEQKPTKRNILKEIQILVNNIPQDQRVVLFFHYSGHGSYTYDRNNDEADKRDETICPTDYAVSGVISDDILKANLVDTLPSNVEMYCVMDCCHSGTGLDLRYECRVETKDEKVASYQLIQNKSEKSQAKVVLLSGCKDNQYSADAYIAGKYQGALTWGFLEVMRKNKYTLSFKKLLKDIHQLLRIRKYEQVPQLSFGKYEDLSAKFELL